MPGLPKFFLDNETSNDRPISQVSNAWDIFNDCYIENRRSILQLLGEAGSGFISTHRSPQISYEESHRFMALEIEERLRAEFPEFATAAEGLKQALVLLHGTRITWNHYIRGEGLVPTSPENTGYVVGSGLGPSAPLAIAAGGYPIWLNISNDFKLNGINHSLYDMYAIRGAEEE